MSLPTDPVPYAEFVVRYLMQHPVPGEPLLAVSETELPIDGDLWFWADDNAKILEFFAIPELWRRYPEESKSLLKFINDLCFGPFILRRIGHARLTEVRNDGSGNAQFIHTFMHIGCDLARGIVILGMRFHDGRTAKNLILSGNWVEFSFENQRHRLSVNENVTDFSVRRDGPLLILEHVSELNFQHDGSEQRFGSIKYSYTIDERSMFVGVKAKLTLDAEREFSDIVLTISHDDLSHGDNHVDYGALRLLHQDNDTCLTAEEPGEESFFQSGVRYWALVQSGWMKGFALAVHSISENQDRFLKFETEVKGKGKWHRVAACYRFDGQYSGVDLAIGEQKILTAGGFYDRTADYERMFDHFNRLPKSHPLDFSISYDYGAEINAFARVFRVLSSLPETPETLELKVTARGLFDDYYNVYAEVLMKAHEGDSSAIFSRPLAFVAFSLIDMFFATQEERYRSELRRVVDILLSFERPFVGEDGKPESAFLMGLVQSASPYVDCHSAVLLALVRALPVLEDPALITKIDQGLDAYRVETMGIPLGDMRKLDLLCVGRQPQGEQPIAYAYWNFTAGITLRLFKLLRQSNHQATSEIYDRHKHRIAIQEALLNLQIDRSLRERDGALEIKTGWLSTEGNSETQPWVALGLVTDSGDLPPDHQFPNALMRPINRDDVIAAYRLILGREPESEEAIANNLLNGDLGLLRKEFLNSDEFRRQMLSVVRHQPSQ
jgi:hypothetical protein